MNTTGPIERLMLELGRLPGIGGRSAARLAYYIIRQSPKSQRHSLARDLAAALMAVDEQVGLCERCFNLATETFCSICCDSRREARTICVVESVSDLRALEHAGSFAGHYHVLHGALSPLEGVGPEALKVEHLQARVAADAVQEVILALNTTLEGDTTALYLATALQASGVRVTRLASGVPHGGELEYLDRATLGRAMADRRLFATS